MSLLTVQQYANQSNVSVQSCYQRIKRGTLRAVDIDGKQMIDTDLLNTDTSHAINSQQPIQQDIKPNEIKALKTLHNEVVKLYKREIKRLNKELEYCRNHKDSSYLRLEKLFDKLYSTPEIIHDTDIIVPEPPKKKKKKKNKSK